MGSRKVDSFILHVNLLFLQRQEPIGVNWLFLLPLRRNLSIRMIFCCPGEFCVVWVSCCSFWAVPAWNGASPPCHGRQIRCQPAVLMGQSHSCAVMLAFCCKAGKVAISPSTCLLWGCLDMLLFSCWKTSFMKIPPKENLQVFFTRKLFFFFFNDSVCL